MFLCNDDVYLHPPMNQPSPGCSTDEDQPDSCLDNLRENRGIFLNDDDIYLNLPIDHPSQYPGEDEDEPDSRSDNPGKTIETFVGDDAYLYLTISQAGGDKRESDPCLGEKAQKFLDDDIFLYLPSTKARRNHGNDENKPDSCRDHPGEITDYGDTYQCLPSNIPMTLLNDSFPSLDDSIVSLDDACTLLEGSSAVRFDINKNLVHKIEMHKTPEMLWLSSTEFKFMKMRDMLLAKLVETGNFIESEEHTNFGLRVDMEHGACTAKLSRLAVLTEQECQHIAGQHDPTQITVQYAFASLDAWKKARHRGQQTARQVLPTELECQVVTSPWQRLTQSQNLPRPIMYLSSPRNFTHGSNIKYDEEEGESKVCLLPAMIFRLFVRQRAQNSRFEKPGYGDV